jgi:hypothetical protein
MQEFSIKLLLCIIARVSSVQKDIKTASNLNPSSRQQSRRLRRSTGVCDPNATSPAYNLKAFVSRGRVVRGAHVDV